MVRKFENMDVEYVANIRGGSGKGRIHKMFKPEELNSKFKACVKLVLEPGTYVGLHEHINEDEIYIITKGKGLFDDGETKTEVTVGDAMITSDKEKHGLENIGSTDLELIGVISEF